MPDSLYHSVVLAKFINHVMLSGKKSVSETIVYGALEIAFDKYKKQKSKESGDSDSSGGEGGSSGTTVGQLTPVSVFEAALDNVRPSVEVKSRRVGGATYQVPIEVKQSRRDTLAMRWIIDAARGRSEKGMQARLAAELFDVLNSRGSAVKKREDVHKMAKANQAFAHFRLN